LTDPLPPDILMDARQDKIHEDLSGRRAVNAVRLEPPDASFDCPNCAESVDGQPGNGACQQCREEDENVTR
jgi:Zn finger protein HypA/HybF involved in hydrogenase expression